MALTLSGCALKNDMAYPKVNVAVTAFAVDGQKSVTIDAERKVVKVVIDEVSDISNLLVTDFTYTEGVTCSIEMPQHIDLSVPMKFTLSVYDTCDEWKIECEQPIERFVKIKDMIGDAEFDVDNRIAYVYLTEDYDFSAVVVEDMKLEAEGYDIVRTRGYESIGGEPQVRERETIFPMTLDCSMVRTFVAENDGKTVEWSLKVLPKIIELQITKLIPWSYSAELEFMFKGQTPVVEIKKSSSSKWETVDGVVITGVTGSLNLESLRPGYQYDVRITCGENECTESFKTGLPLQIPNSDFETWSMVGNTWYPCEASELRAWTCNSGVWSVDREGACPHPWDTANKGVNTGKAVNPSSPCHDHTAKPESKTAVKLVNAQALGLFAAGNIITGEFYGVEVSSAGAGAVLTWGSDFTGRPYALHGYYDYHAGTVNSAPRKGYEQFQGKPDTCQILFMLTDWDQPFLVKSALAQYVDFENDEHIIAMATIESDVDTGGEYVEFTLPLEYRDPTRTPKYVVMIACCSLRGNFFTGSYDSVMYVDDWELIYK